MEKYSWSSDWELNHSGEILEDMLGNNKEATRELRKAMSWDNKARFKFTMLIAFLLVIVAISFLFVRFIPGIVSLWIFGMVAGMFIAGLFGMLFSMPVIDSVGVHLRVIDYVDNVIRNTQWTPNNLMDGSVRAAELVERDRDDSEDDEDEEVEMSY